MGTADTKFNNNFNAIRFIAALMVMGGHMTTFLNIRGNIFFDSIISNIGVKILFVIGGYLITKSWLSDPHVIRYALKRFLRIWPPLLATVFFAVFLVGPVFTTLSLKDYFANPSTWNYFQTLRFRIAYILPGVFENLPYPKSVNGSLWTLPLEIRLYIIIPILLVFIKLIGKRKIVYIITIGITSIAYIIQQYFFKQWNGVIGGFNLTIPGLELLPYYFTGMCYTLPEAKKLLNLPIAVCMLMFWALIPFGYLENGVISFIVLPYVVLSLAFTDCEFLRKIFKRDISYGIYLFAFPIQQSVIAIFMKFHIPFEGLIMFGISVVLTIICAYISFFAVERPMQKLLKKILTHIS